MILSLLKLAEHWLYIKTVRAKWELECDIEKHIQDCETAIRRARLQNDDAAADRIRQQLLRSSAISVATISSAAPAAGANVHGSKS